MRDTYRPRRILAVFAALALPAVTCGVAPALQDLLQRVERLEQFAANAELPLVLMDEHSIVVGTVLEYNDLFLFASVNTRNSNHYPGVGPWANPEDFAVATLQYRIPGRPPLMLEANREELLAPSRGHEELFYFESPDCTGRPWVNSHFFEYVAEGRGGTVFSRGWIGPPGKTLYAVYPDTSEQRVTVQSSLYTVGIVQRTQSTCQPLSRPYPTDMRPLEPVSDLSVYTPPFRVVDQREYLLP